MVFPTSIDSDLHVRDLEAWRPSKVWWHCRSESNSYPVLGNFNPGRWKIATFGVPYEICLDEIDSYYNSSGAIRLPEELLAPELAHSSSYDNKADIWRLGSIICELFTKQRPFSSQWDVEDYRVGRRLLDIHLHPSLIPVLEPPIRNMMAVDPSERPTADSLLQVWSRALEYFDSQEFEDQFNHSSSFVLLLWWIMINLMSNLFWIWFWLCIYVCSVDECTVLYGRSLDLI